MNTLFPKRTSDRVVGILLVVVVVIACLAAVGIVAEGLRALAGGIW